MSKKTEKQSRRDREDEQARKNLADAFTGTDGQSKEEKDEQVAQMLESGELRLTESSKLVHADGQPWKHPIPQREKAINAFLDSNRAR